MTQMTDDRQRFVANTWYLGGAQLVGTAATYVLLFALTKLGTEAYGLWVLTLLLASYRTPWATLGLASALIRFCPTFPRFQEQAAAYRLASRASWWFSVLVALGMAAGAKPLAAALLTGPQQWPLVVLAALLIPLEAQFQLGNSFLQVQERLGTYAALTSLRHLSEMGVLAALVYWLPDLELMLGARVLILLLLVAGQHLVACRGQGSAVALHRGEELKRYLQFGLPMIPATFIWVLIMGLDRFMLGKLATLNVVAVYHAADTVAVFLLNYTRPINGILQPRLANLIDRDPVEAQKYLGAAVKYLAILLFPGAVGLALVAGPLLGWVSHPEFSGAAALVPLLGVAYLLIGLTNPLYHLVFLRHGGKVFIWLYTLCLGVNFMLNWLLIPSHGGKGAVLATLGAFAVYVIGLLVCSEKSTLRTLRGLWRPLSLAAGCSLMMGGVLLALRKYAPLADSLLLVPLGAGIYGLLLLASGLISRAEWLLLASPVLRLKDLLSARGKALRLVSQK